MVEITEQGCRGGHTGDDLSAESVEPWIFRWSEPMIAWRTRNQPVAGISNDDGEPTAPASGTTLGTPVDDGWHHARSEPRMLPLSTRSSGKGMPGWRPTPG